MRVWQPGSFLSQTYSFQALSNTVILQTDVDGCLTDTFNITVLQNDSCGFLSNPAMEPIDFHAYFSGDFLHIEAVDLSSNYLFMDQAGRKIDEFVLSSKVVQLNYADLPKGSYFLVNQSKGTSIKIRK